MRWERKQGRREETNEKREISDGNNRRSLWRTREKAYLCSEWGKEKERENEEEGGNGGRVE